MQFLEKHQWPQMVEQLLSASPDPLIVILGPTASGKTSFSIELAEWIADHKPHGWQGAEVLNADSRQFYRGLDIGTAKITQEEMRAVPHHLLDVLDPREEASIAWFQREAKACIAAIHQRKNVPLLVGGSMLYVSAIVDNLDVPPPAAPARRAEFMREFEEQGGEGMYRRLQQLDPVRAKSLHPNNMPRLVRALEIAENGAAENGALKAGRAAADAKVDDSTLMLGVYREREEIRSRITKRAEQMFAAGWIAEVRTLQEAGYGPDDPGMKSHGYRDIMRYLQDGVPPTEEELHEQIAAQTRQYARRQMTWWKRDPRIHWLAL